MSDKPKKQDSTIAEPNTGGGYAYSKDRLSLNNIYSPHNNTDSRNKNPPSDYGYSGGCYK